MLAMSLVGSGNLLANYLQNPGFEEGNIGWFGDAGFTLPGWIFWGTDAWCHNNTGGYIDTQATLIWSDGVGVIQDFPVTPDREYSFSVLANSLISDNNGLHGWDGVYQVEWFDSDNYLIYKEEIGRYYGALVMGTPIDPYNTWKEIADIRRAPFPAAYCRAYLYLVSNGGDAGGSLCWDNVYAALAYAAEDPVPANNDSVDPSLPTTLSWTRPAARHAGDTILCDVWFGQDPNMPGANTKILDKEDTDSVVVGPLSGNQAYYWRVDCYDPNGMGSEVKTEGDTWIFNTDNAAPTVDAGGKQSLWLSSGTATASMNAEATDDGLPNPPAALTYDWSILDGPAGATFSPSNTVENPDVTFTAAGSYTLQVIVSDSEKTADDTVLVKVYEEGYTGLVAYWALDETSGSTAVDSAGGHDGTVVGNPVWTDGKVNGAIQLDGDGDYIDCGGGKFIDPNATTWADLREEITISAWVKGTFTKSWQAIVDKGDSSWRLFRDNTYGDSDNVSFTLNGVGPVISGSTGPVGDSRWHQVVGTFDGTRQCIYVDGILAASRDIPEGTLIDLNDYNVRIGSDEQFDGVREFNGLIDEVRIYEIGLPADMVMARFIADGGSNSCGLDFIPGDINEDCYVDVSDFAQMAESWLMCNDVTNSNCQ